MVRLRTLERFLNGLFALHTTLRPSDFSNVFVHVNRYGIVSVSRNPGSV